MLEVSLCPAATLAPHDGSGRYGYGGRRVAACDDWRSRPQPADVNRVGRGASFEDLLPEFIDVGQPARGGVPADNEADDPRRFRPPRRRGTKDRGRPGSGGGRNAAGQRRARCCRQGIGPRGRCRRSRGTGREEEKAKQTGGDSRAARRKRRGAGTFWSIADKKAMIDYCRRARR
jgi:hypothetical protein